MEFNEGDVVTLKTYNYSEAPAMVIIYTNQDENAVTCKWFNGVNHIFEKDTFNKFELKKLK